MSEEEQAQAEFPHGEVSEEEENAMREMLGYGFPQQEEKENIYNYFKKVIYARNNTKTGYLKEDELGVIRLPLRTNLQLAHYCEKMGMNGFSKYFNDEAQIISASSLSREGFLNNLAVTQKRESSLRTRNIVGQQQRRGFFGKPLKGGEQNE